MKKYQMNIALGIVCMVLVIGICVQINTVNTMTTGTGTARTTAENELKDNILKWKEKYDNAYKKSEELENELEELRSKTSDNSQETAEMEASLKYINMALGLTEVTGKGLTITLKDAEISSQNVLDISSYVVHYLDLVQVVNALKNAGAEAISINGQRIVSTTGIECAGNIIKINGEKIGVPFKISAIGLQEKLYGALTMPGGYIDMLEDDGIIVTIERPTTNITIPKYNGVYKSDYMKPTN